MIFDKCYMTNIEVKILEISEFTTEEYHNYKAECVCHYDTVNMS